MMKALSTALVGLFVTLALAGCGQTGPLYLPGDAPESQTDGPFGMDDDTATDDEGASDQTSEATDNTAD
ncbi:hypothetical protein T5B8_15385 [Salinisphaera sp. T5B8]